MTQDFEERFKRLEQEVNRDSKTNANFKWKTPSDLSTQERANQGAHQSKGSSVKEWIWIAAAVFVVLVLGRMALGMAFGLVFMVLNLAVFAAIIAGVIALFRFFKK